MSVRSRVREEISLFQRMRRIPGRGWIAGVCAGLAEFFDWNVKLIRVLFVAGFVLGGFFPVGVIYLVLWYLMEPEYTDGSGPELAARYRRYRHRHDRHGGDDVGGGDAKSYAYARNGASTADVKARFSRLEQRLRNMEDCVTSHDFELRRELKKLES